MGYIDSGKKDGATLYKEVTVMGTKDILSNLRFLPILNLI